MKQLIYLKLTSKVGMNLNLRIVVVFFAWFGFEENRDPKL